MTTAKTKKYRYRYSDVNDKLDELDKLVQRLTKKAGNEWARQITRACPHEKNTILSNTKLKTVQKYYADLQKLQLALEKAVEKHEKLKGGGTRTGGTDISPPEDTTSTDVKPPEDQPEPEPESEEDDEDEEKRDERVDAEEGAEPESSRDEPEQPLHEQVYYAYQRLRNQQKYEEARERDEETGRPAIKAQRKKDDYPSMKEEVLEDLLVLLESNISALCEYPEDEPIKRCQELILQVRRYFRQKEKAIIAFLSQFLEEDTDEDGFIVSPEEQAKKFQLGRWFQIRNFFTKETLPPYVKELEKALDSEKRQHKGKAVRIRLRADLLAPPATTEKPEASHAGTNGARPRSDERDPLAHLIGGSTPPVDPLAHLL